MVQAKIIPELRNESSWKSVSRHIHRNSRCVGCGDLHAGTICFTCINSAF